VGKEKAWMVFVGIIAGVMGFVYGVKNAV